ncbi:hypothetical protein CQA40_01695 [Helicobacter sp. MIT 01-3238]|nr:hypothetical protein CQA40_01695 [Helicobacter sp. MIT 01-3238]
MLQFLLFCPKNQPKPPYTQNKHKNTQKSLFALHKKHSRKAFYSHSKAFSLAAPQANNNKINHKKRGMQFAYNISLS